MTVLRRFYPDAHFAAPAQESAVSALENPAQTPLAAEASSAAIASQLPAPEGTAPSPSLPIRTARKFRRR